MSEAKAQKALTNAINNVIASRVSSILDEFKDEMDEELHDRIMEKCKIKSTTEKKTKDPNKPTNPQNAYMLFIKDVRALLKEVGGEKGVKVSDEFPTKLRKKILEAFEHEKGTKLQQQVLCQILSPIYKKYLNTEHFDAYKNKNAEETRIYHEKMEVYNKQHGTVKTQKPKKKLQKSEPKKKVKTSKKEKEESDNEESDNEESDKEESDGKEEKDEEKSDEEIEDKKKEKKKVNKKK